MLSKMGFRTHRTSNVSLTRSKLSQIIQIDCCFYGTVRCVFNNKKIVAMMAEINSLKKECRGTADKTNKPKTTGKKPATKKAPPKKPMDQKKKAVDKWAWKSKPPKESDNKEDNTFVKTFKNKKYYWCINHNNGMGMWMLHHPKYCAANKGTARSTMNANITAFDTMDSKSNQE